MSSAKSPTGSLFQNSLGVAVRAAVVAAAVAPAFLLQTVPGLAQSQGPSTSGGNLPYIATGQSEDEIQKRKRARAEADEHARQEAARAAEEERARQDAARIAAQPEPAAATPAPSATAPAATATVPPADATKPKAVARPRPTDLPPGVNPNVVAAEPRVAPQQPRTAAMPAQPQHGVVVVRRPMFFGLFGPEVNVTERVVILTPPANIGSTQAGPRPPAPIGAPRVVNRRPAENCHYHTRQAPGMGYAHGDIQCHWHQDPNDPSLRYVD